MSLPDDFNQLPDPNYRAFRTREAVGWFLKTGAPQLLINLAVGTRGQEYTFGILDETGHVPSQLVVPQQIGFILGSRYEPGQVYVQTAKPARQVLSPARARDFRLRIHSRQFRLLFDQLDSAIVAADDERIGQSAIQLIG